MITFFAQNIGTIAVTLILAAVVAMIIIKLNKNKKIGRSSCGCGCGSCPHSELCHRPIQK